MINNLRTIREIYGATQSEIASVIGMSRVTLAKWEKDSENKLSYSILEKLSLFFGIGPECFYEIELDEKRKQMIVDASIKAKEVDSDNNTSKENHFKNIFSNTTFDQAISKYMFSMKMLLALSDDGDVDDLRIVLKINEKMNKRLESIISIKEEEQDRESINDLIGQLSIDI